MMKLLCKAHKNDNYQFIQVNYINLVTMLFSKSCHFVLLFAYLLSANADMEPRVNLGTAERYAILTKTGVSTVPPSAITGDIAVSPIAGTAITGFSLTLAADGKSSTSAQVTGTAYAASYVAPTPSHLTVAIGNMETAYTDAAGRPNDDAERMNLEKGKIGGQILTPGVYTFGSDVTIKSKDVTFRGSNGANADDDIFIIQMTGNLKVDKYMKVILEDGAQAKNIFWQVAGEVNVEEGAHMEGILLVKTDVTFITGSSLNGRVLAQTACVLQSAKIDQPTPVERANGNYVGNRNLRHH
jgi:hypothetical protein